MRSTAARARPPSRSAEVAYLPAGRETAPSSRAPRHAHEVSIGARGSWGAVHAQRSGQSGAMSRRSDVRFVEVLRGCVSLPLLEAAILGDDLGRTQRHLRKPQVVGSLLSKPPMNRHLIVFCTSRNLGPSSRRARPTSAQVRILSRTASRLGGHTRAPCVLPASPRLPHTAKAGAGGWKR